MPSKHAPLARSHWEFVFADCDEHDVLHEHVKTRTLDTLEGGKHGRLTSASTHEGITLVLTLDYRRSCRVQEINGEVRMPSLKFGTAFAKIKYGFDTPCAEYFAQREAKLLGRIDALQTSTFASPSMSSLPPPLLFEPNVMQKEWMEAFAKPFPQEATANTVWFASDKTGQIGKSMMCDFISEQPMSTGLLPLIEYYDIPGSTRAIIVARLRNGPIDHVFFDLTKITTLVGVPSWFWGLLENLAGGKVPGTSKIPFKRIRKPWVIVAANFTPDVEVINQRKRMIVVDVNETYTSEELDTGAPGARYPDLPKRFKAS